MEFKLEQNVKVTVTHDISNHLVELLNLTNYSHPMIVVDSFLLGSSIIQDFLENMDEKGFSYYIYDKVVPDPPIELIDEGAELFSKNNCDAIIAIGGGSVIDAARGINIVRLFGGNIKDYVYDKLVPSLCPGLISVPTTSGTGSELSNALVVTDTKSQEKLAILADNAVSEYAVLDPRLVTTVPKNMTIITGLDVFSHAAEAYTSKLSSPVVDAICEKIMFLVVKYLPAAVNHPENLEARERMMVAAALGGWVLNNGGTHLGHSLAHVVGAKMGIPHGMAAAYALPATLSLTAEVEPKKVREIGNILNVTFPENATHTEIGDHTAEGYKHFRDEILGLPAFEQQEITREQLLALKENVLNERFAANSPFDVTPKAVSFTLNQFG
ncbi:MAG: iron-containing alcohol dehydrogenase [Alkalibacterium sp.]|nr:iron-containing alcohol dehydrogenase [Alkalibacterium sp.]MDN6729856.1 iron-containing alcohol dehydrogenase [Alkalibacterium sp.]